MFICMFTNKGEKMNKRFGEATAEQILEDALEVIWNETCIFKY